MIGCPFCMRAFAPLAPYTLLRFVRLEGTEDFRNFRIGL